MSMLLLSTADTELRAARASGADWRVANPSRVDAAGVPALLEGVAVVVVRLLGGRQAWSTGLDAVLARRMPVIVLGGEAAPDAALMAASTVPSGVATHALAYLAEGGPDNLRELYRFLSDTLLLTGEGFAPPQEMPAYGVRAGHTVPGERAGDRERPCVGVVYYRAHELSGNAAFVDVLCDAVRAAGADPLPVFCGSLRGADSGLSGLLGR
ncbi:MAG TPA: cobaltochelatase subunit CobN, partial [Mycobacteriales bacterium]